MIKLFDVMTPGLQAKFFSALMSNPGVSLPALLDKVERKLTLAEQAEAEQALRDAKRVGVL